MQTPILWVIISQRSWKLLIIFDIFLKIRILLTKVVNQSLILSIFYLRIVYFLLSLVLRKLIWLHKIIIRLLLKWKLLRVHCFGKIIAIIWILIRIILRIIRAKLRVLKLLLRHLKRLIWIFWLKIVSIFLNLVTICTRKLHL